MRVVVALDGSGLSAASLKWVPLLEPLGLESVSLIAVSETFDEGVEVRFTDEYFERQCVLLTAYLRDVEKKLRPVTSAEVDSEVRAGNADEEIRKFAKGKNADLLMITTHGRSGVSRWAIGSVADKVLRLTDTPSFVIGPNAAQLPPPASIRGILVPLDGSALAEHGLDISAKWAKGLGAALHLVRVINYPIVYSEEVAPYTPEILESLRQISTDYLEKAKEKCAGIETKTAVLLGPAASELIDYAEENPVDLAIMTCRGRRGVARAVLGSTTDRLLHGPCPVVVLPVS